jgi:quercetin dioxygenase-like cupin family protein
MEERGSPALGSLSGMKPKDVRDLVFFNEDEARHETLSETEKLWSQVVCLQHNQALGPMGDPEADALCLVLAGQIAVQVGKSRARMGQWESITVPAGEDLTLKNASEEPSVVLLVTAPPPAPASL